MGLILAATWSDGLFVFTPDARQQELAGHSMTALAHDRGGAVLAIVDGNTLRRRAADGAWTTIVANQPGLASLVVVGDVIYLGTDDARVLRVREDNTVEPLPGFATVPGRDTWYAGSAVIDGRVVGPPLGVRSMSATSDGALLVNVHVGGIPRSTDGGVTWRPTIDVQSDVHEVCAHPDEARTVIAAAAVGLCVSRDGGATWAIEQQGLHAAYCSAVAFSANTLLVAASTDHFAAQGAVYRRPADGTSPLQTVGGGLPRWLGGIVDTGCIASLGETLAIADKAGDFYTSADAGQSWLHRDKGLAGVSKLLVVS